MIVGSSRPLTMLKRLALGGIVAAGLSACGSPGGPSGGHADVGAKLWHDYSCLSCHMVNGFGGTDGPDLTQNISATNYQLLKDYIEHPPVKMQYVQTKHLKISNQDLHDMNAFVNSRLVAPGPIPHDPGG